MFQIINTFLDPVFIIKTLGLIGVLVIVFAESGLFFGFFLPGDSLIFTAGFLASQGLLPTVWLFVGVFIAAVLGDSVGYAFGKKIGPKVFTREDSVFFSRKHLERSRNFYNRYGKKTIVLARFVPIVRTFAPILAGVGDMRYKTFIVYNIVGGFVWSAGMTALGFMLGAVVPNADSYVLPIVILIIIISLMPPVLEYLRSRRNEEKK